MEEGLFKKKLSYPYEKCRSNEPFFEPLKLGRENYLSTSKERYPVFEGIIRTQEKLVRNTITNMKDLTSLSLKTDVFLLTDTFQN